jgi:hypothetical protein
LSLDLSLLRRGTKALNGDNNFVDFLSFHLQGLNPKRVALGTIAFGRRQKKRFNIANRNYDIALGPVIKYS